MIYIDLTQKYRRLLKIEPVIYIIYLKTKLITSSRINFINFN